MAAAIAERETDSFIVSKFSCYSYTRNVRRDGSQSNMLDLVSVYEIYEAAEDVVREEKGEKKKKGKRTAPTLNMGKFHR